MTRGTILRSGLFLAGLAATTAFAFWWPEATRPPRPFEAGMALLQEGRAQDAVYLLDDPLWRGVASYRAGRYMRAAGDFITEGSDAGLYNLGTTYAHLHEWKGAITAFETVLRRRPDHEDARHNLDIVRRAKEMEEKELAAQRQGDKSLPEMAGRREAAPSGVSAGTPGIGGEPAGTELQKARSAPGASTSIRSEVAGLAGDATERKPEAEGWLDPTTQDDVDAEGETPTGGTAVAMQGGEREQRAAVMLARFRDNPAKVLRSRLHMAQRLREGAD
ncbi:MAG: tetratricopeptide repeat protein [Geminicoccaceae bacterium]